MYNVPEHTGLLSYPPTWAHEALPWLSNTRLSLSTRGSHPEATRGFPIPGQYGAPGAHEAPH